MALHSQALLVPNAEVSFFNAQLHRLYRVKPIKSKCLCRRLIVASATPRRKEPRKEISLDQHDLMTLEFGRLLGESEEKTLSKVLRRKIDPGLSFVELESKAKGGKGFMSNADFVVKVERSETAFGNASKFSPGLPHLTSPPTRQGGFSSINFPKLGSDLPSNANTEIASGDSLLRKPSTSQVARVGLPVFSPISPEANSSQSKLVFEDDSEDLHGLRRPSIAKGQETGKSPLDSSDQVKKNKTVPSQKLKLGVSHVLLDDSECVETSKLEFQRLLDKSFGSSSDTASAPVTHSNSYREYPGPTQERYISKLTGPTRPQFHSHLPRINGVQQLVDRQDEKSLLEVDEVPQQKLSLDSAVPHLASRPERQKGSVGTFVLRAKARNTATPSSMKSHTVDVSNELLLRKPKDQESDNFNLLSTQHSERCHTLGDVEVLKSSKPSLQLNLEKPSTVPHLATPPSRHSESFGKFSGVGRQKIRGIDSTNKDSVDSDTDESLLRKPSHLEKTKEDICYSSWREANTAPLSISTPKKTGDELVDDTLLCVPSREADTAQVYVQSSHQLDDLKQGVGAHQLEGEASQLSSLADLPVVSQDIGAEEEFEELSGLDGASQVSNGVSNVFLSVGLQDVHHSSKSKQSKLAPLKKPVKISLSDPMVYASESKSPQQESAAQASDMSSEVLQSMPQSNDKRQNPSLAIGCELKTLPSECEADESLGIQSSVDTISVAEQVSDEYQKRDQGTHEQLGVAKNQISDLLLDEVSYAEAASEEPTSDLLQQSKEALRRPTQFTPANASMQQSEQLDFPASSSKLHLAKEEEAKEWARAEAMLKSKEQVEVKLIGSNSAGVFVSFGCLVGFLPSFELSPKRGLLDFPSWAQKNGIDLSLKNAPFKRDAINGSQSSTVQAAEMSNLAASEEGDLNELKNKYREEISKLMSSFVGEKTKVIVKLIDKMGRKLKLSEKEADPGYCEHVQKKANLMAELKLGVVVTCEVKSITPIGVFVEVGGVPALIHHSEVSWNKRVEPASLLNVGQVIKAKVCRLDRALQRINLSLKQMQTDPLKRTLESVVGESENDSAICVLDAIEPTDVFWPELEDLTKKLEKMDGIASVSRGRCLNSAAFAPTFQVLISTPQSNGYKLLARYGNKIHEILVDTSLDRDKMKDCIRLCTFANV